MSLEKRYGGYESFSYLMKGSDYKEFELTDELERVTPYRLPLDEAKEARLRALVERCLLVSMHEHLGVFPDRI